MIESPTLAFWVSLVTVLAAAVIDARTRRIPNWLVGAYFAAGLAVRFAAGGTQIYEGMAGLAVAALVTAPLVIFGGLGSGDSKLMAAFGLWVGPVQTLYALTWTAVAGGLLAVGYALSKGMLRRSLAGAAQVIYNPLAARERLIVSPEDREPLTMPYAPAIAVGALISFFVW